jgi:dihydropteroate synthase
MGIVNATPDSFSGDGVGTDVDAAVELGLMAFESGADIVDVGGESSRPGATPVAVEEEMARVLPVVQRLRARTDLPISVDTSKAAVAQAALDAGADVINDVWAFQADPLLAPLVARRQVAAVLMHNASRAGRVRVQPGVGAHFVEAPGEDVLAQVSRGLAAAVRTARSAGIADGQLILDPGIGFGKTLEQNLELLDRVGELGALGFPILVGPSRKSFIGLTLDQPPQERLEGTAAAVAVAIARGADMVRVHDVRAMVQVARMTDAIVRRS